VWSGQRLPVPGYGEIFARPGEPGLRVVKCRKFRGGAEGAEKEITEEKPVSGPAELGRPAERARKPRQPPPMPPAIQYLTVHRLRSGAEPARPLTHPVPGSGPGRSGPVGPARAYLPKIARTMKAPTTNAPTPPAPAGAASKKRKQRSALLAEFAASPHSAVVTDAEWAYLRRAFKTKFGHDWTVGSRRSHRDMSLATSAPKARVDGSGGQQQTLF